MHPSMKFRILCIMLFTLPFLNPAEAQLTYTQDLIREEIIRLGGEWEGSDAVKRICFAGELFKTEHFEMLSHCSGLEWFEAHDIRLCDKDALKHLLQIRSLIRVDLLGAGDLADGLEHIPVKCSKLEEVRVEAKHLSIEAFSALQKVQSLRHLSLEVGSLEREQCELVSRMKQLKYLYIESSLDPAVEKSIRDALINCEVVMSPVISND